MIICPVCEHPQAQGDECDQCGKRLSTPRSAGAAPVAPLPELELTPHVGGKAPVPVERVAELAPTREAPVGALPPERVPDLEATRSAPALNVVELPLDELETGRAEDDGVRTAAPAGAAVCRYCRNVQAEGLVCDKCGMRLPRLRPTAKAAAEREDADATYARCPRCHVRGRVGRPCTDCGTVVRATS
ncbi:hypothetical protein FGE12_16540 [Aggregicoccus sp. 17bor-14]|uniref:hypothetical protein n=1 Tax=Myxococcaceae TaxID=31 RepID=UPI00129C14B7|nr:MULTISPECIES: hypothetical protein [Myxococcaceae]MBF5044008.1 hypothetical protein [Simulacricoccus sp. 17bor-14]MRI89759.1 hypothetical protein [Aggregicoccus sp. 17bor-14]